MAGAARCRALPLIRLMMIWVACTFLCDCAAVNWIGGRQTTGIKEQDFDDLRSGNLLAVRDRYESRRPELNDQELAILCDIYVQHVAISPAMACLAELEQRPGSTGNQQQTADAIKGKRALVSFLQGNYSAAAAAADGLTSDGGRYIYALAMLKLGEPGAATATAEEWRLSYRPAQVLLAANLYLASGDYPSVLSILEEPERRLDRDYSLSGGKDIFGAQIDAAPLRVDMFNEFGFGLLDTYSYAPRGNVYVEYALAKAELETGDREAARRRYETILAFPWIDAYRDVRWRALADRARLAEEEGDRDQAVADYQQAIDVIESARASITTDAGRIGFVGDKQDVYGRLIKLLIADGHAAEAFEYSERSRARALVDLLASVEEFGPRTVPKTEQDAAIRNYERAAIELAQTKEMHPEQVASGTRGLIASYRNLEGRLPYMVSSNVAVPPPNWPELAASLMPDEVLLSYFKYGKEWGVFLIARGRNPEYIQLPEANLDEDVQAFWSAIQGGKSPDEYKKLAERLYNVLIAPAAERSPGKVLPENLTITPYGSLHYLPFAALVAPDGRYLVDAHAISVLPNAEIRRYLVARHAAAASPRALALGNPKRVAENGDPGAPPPLLWAEAEAVMVAKEHRSSLLLLGENATKDRFLNLAPRYPILHIAAHGVYDPTNPLQSRLLLAPDSTNGDLTVEGLFAGVEQPWQAQVAMLSACNTATGAVGPGQDVVGLERGFLYAGVDSLVGTLWSIRDDAGTLQMVEQFYAALGRGESGAQALRSAQRAMFRGRYFEPVHWAAFTFTGLHARGGSPRSRPESVTTMLRSGPHLTAQGAAAG